MDMIRSFNIRCVIGLNTMTKPDSVFDEDLDRHATVKEIVRAFQSFLGNSLPDGLTPPTYITQASETTLCPECDSHDVWMLCPVDYTFGDAAFYICQECHHIAQIGVGAVKHDG